MQYKIRKCKNMYNSGILLLSLFQPKQNIEQGPKRRKPGKQRRQNRTDLIFLQISYVLYYSNFKLLSKYVRIEKRGLKDINEKRTTCDIYMKWILSNIRIIFFHNSIYVYFYSVLIFSIDNMWKFVTFYILFLISIFTVYENKRKFSYTHFPRFIIRKMLFALILQFKTNEKYWVEFV